MLNQDLIKQQNISKKQQQRLMKLYKELEEFFAYVRDLTEDEAKKLGYALTITLKDIEFQLQENWNFEQNALYHTWWDKIPKCSCPKLDNKERFGVEKIINCGCIIHSHLCKGEEE